jgi:hypothetical protein
MEKLDYKKTYKKLYAPSSKGVSLVEVPSFNYIMVSGEGSPDGEAASKAISALFPVAYKIKFLLKAKGTDYAVMPLEGLWWADDMDDFINGKRENWKWTYMIMQPDVVNKKDFEQALIEVKKKKDLPDIDKVQFNSLEEGRSAEILHIGPFTQERPNIEKIHEYIKEIGGHFDGHMQKHHEIYLSDIRKIAPENLRTILRQPYVD